MTPLLDTAKRLATRLTVVAALAVLTACQASPTAPTAQTLRGGHAGGSAAALASAASTSVVLIIPPQDIVVERLPGGVYPGWIQGTLRFGEERAAGEINLVIGGSPAGQPSQPEKERLHVTIDGGTIAADGSIVFEGTGTWPGRDDGSGRFPFAGTARPAADDLDLIFDIVGGTVHGPLRITMRDVFVTSVQCGRSCAG